jgi:hypothetical protein
VQLKGGTTASALGEALNYLNRNSFSKLSYLQHLSSNPQAEVQAVLTATDVDDLGFSLDAGGGNPQALNEVQGYLNLMAGANRQVILNDMVEERFGQRPYGWPEWEVILLVARLVRKGEISLVMDGATLAMDKIYEAVITPSKWRRITIIKRQTVDKGQLQAARNLAKEVFGKIAADGEDELAGFLRERLDGWRTNLAQYKTLSDTGEYPGGQAIADAQGVIAKLLAEKESYGLINRFMGLKNDLLDLSDSVHELENFYETQRPTWEKLRKAYSRFQLNRTWLDKDSAAATALQKVKEILRAESPYGSIKDADSLIQTVEGVDAEIVAKRRGHVLERIDAHIAKIGTELAAANASADLRNLCLLPLQNLRRQVEEQPSIAHINQAQQSATEAADEAFERIEVAVKPKEQPKVGDKERPTYVKKRRIVQPARLAPAGFLETQADVDSYLSTLREELESAIRNEERIEIR